MSNSHSLLSVALSLILAIGIPAFNSVLDSGAIESALVGRGGKVNRSRSVLSLSRASSSFSPAPLFPNSLSQRVGKASRPFA